MPRDWVEKTGVKHDHGRIRVGYRGFFYPGTSLGELWRTGLWFGEIGKRYFVD